MWPVKRDYGIPRITCIRDLFDSINDVTCKKGLRPLTKSMLYFIWTLCINDVTCKKGLRQLTFFSSSFFIIVLTMWPVKRDYGLIRWSGTNYHRFCINDVTCKKGLRPTVWTPHSSIGGRGINDVTCKKGLRPLLLLVKTTKFLFGINDVTCKKGLRPWRCDPHQTCQMLTY